jgi:hypothetical protein
MKNIKLVKADFDRETGISTVIINTDIGKFEGVAKADDVDIQSPSQFMGCELAELRALKKYVKAKFMNIKRVNESLLKVADAIQVHPDSRIDYPFSALRLCHSELYLSCIRRIILRSSDTLHSRNKSEAASPL